MIIGITGGTGSGKSTVCAELIKKGCIIADADAIYRELTLPGKDLVLKIAEKFGDECAPLPERALNRKALAAIVFNDKEKLAQLNALTHKVIGDEIYKIIEANKDKNIILDVPLLFEGGLDKACDEIWTITADLETRISRLMARDNISREEVLARIKNQMSDEERIAKSDLVIINNNITELQKQIDTIAKERLN